MAIDQSDCCIFLQGTLIAYRYSPSFSKWRVTLSFSVGVLLSSVLLLIFFLFCSIFLLFHSRLLLLPIFERKRDMFIVTKKKTHRRSIDIFLIGDRSNPIITLSWGSTCLLNSLLMRNLIMKKNLFLVSPTSSFSSAVFLSWPILSF